MQDDFGSAILTLLVLGTAALWLVRLLRLFRGFSTGFWSGFFTRVFVGTLRTHTGSGALEKGFKWLIIAVLLLVILGWLGGG